MEEAITYAELHFVKSPLKRNVSYPGQESDKDEELSYENVQVPSAPEAPRDLAPGDQAGTIPSPSSGTYSRFTFEMLQRPGHVHSCSSQYLLLGLLLTCLLLGVAAIYLGVHYLQVSHQFGQLSRLLEASNVSLQEQLHLGNVQLEQMEKDLQISTEQLAQSQRALEEEQKAHQVVQEELRDCQAKMQGTLQSTQKLRHLQVILKPFFTCSSQEYDEDGDITYENVQVSSYPEASTDLALPSRPGNQAAVKTEQPTKSWSSALSSGARRMHLCHGHPCCSQYLLLGLLLTCLLLAVAAIWLGMQYLQVSQHYGQLNRLLEVTNSSLQEQLHLGTVQLGQMEKDLQNSKEQLTQSQKALGEEQRVHQAAQKQLQVCKADREKMQEDLHRRVELQQTVQQKLSHLQDTVRPFFTCPSQDTCCMVGWILIQRRCFHISLTKRDWQRSREYCESLSSDLTIVGGNPRSSHYLDHSPWKSLLLKLSENTSYWVGNSFMRDQGMYTSMCYTIEHSQSRSLASQACGTPLPCICEMASFRFPDEDRSLQNSGVHAMRLLGHRP
ncbi:B-cell differentiation antigen CD72-like [Ochotona curzoniae]|uniref:B-cell differentiation antigen CD72-like n=1 Tax=Ochotona curzoniae TaxID=130825 RepID=UPI001B34EAEE|nr:B-cell differentiation antigen CD72-like [Ochotona curzoniae]